MPNPSISLADLQLFGATDLIFVGFHELGLCLLVPPVLLFIVADLVVELFQVMLECNDFVIGGTNCVLKTHDVFVSLLDHVPLVSGPVFC